jgi:hypothetical protein
MKGILKFDLNDFDDKQAHLRAVKSLDLVLALMDIGSELRSKVKYAPDNMSDDTLKAYEDMRDEYYRILSSHGIDIDELVS